MARLASSPFGRRLQTPEGSTYVFDVDSLFTLDFDIPDGLAVELIGTNDSTDDQDLSFLDVVGKVKVLGRLSIKNLQVNFVEGLVDIDQGGSLIFQSSQLIGMRRCPLGFKEIDGYCLYM